MKTFENNKIFINSDEYIYRVEHLTLEGSCSLDHGPRNVKIKKLYADKLDKSNFPEAINFYRQTNKFVENIYHHLGIYCYRLETLERFVSLEQSQNEIKNKLEQLRALDNNIKINVALAKTSSIGVDTMEDFVAIKKIMEYKS